MRLAQAQPETEDEIVPGEPEKKDLDDDTHDEALGAADAQVLLDAEDQPVGQSASARR